MEILENEIKEYIKALKQYSNSGDRNGKYLCPKLKRKVNYRLNKIEKLSVKLGVSFQDRIKMIQKISFEQINGEA